MRISALLIPGLLVLATTGCRTVTHWYLHPDEHEHHADWGYEGETGPEHWGDLHPSYHMAKEGRQQSPIDIHTEDLEDADLPALEFDYRAEPATLVNNGHTLQHDEGPGNWMTVGGKRYQLKQFHVHTPSEHTIDGVSYPLELHLVHQSDDGDVAVVAVLAKSGGKNAVLVRIHGESLPDAGEEKRFEGSINPIVLLPEERSYYRYQGSFTTPPCTEGVLWLVMKTPVEASTQNVADFREMLGANNRPVQPLNDRVVEQ